MEEGVREAVTLALDPRARTVAAQAGERFAAAHRGAAQKTAEAVLGLLTR
jgi:3-deoxy-D-manno-octulosonic-acid transferase